MQDILKLINQP